MAAKETMFMWKYKGSPAPDFDSLPVTTRINSGFRNQKSESCPHESLVSIFKASVICK